MGLPSFIGNMTGAGKVKTPSTTGAGNDYLALLNSYQKGTQSLFDTASQFAPKYGDLLAGEFARLAPGATSIVRGSNPNAYALLDRMTATANSLPLQYGAPLSPQMLRYSNQLTRSGQAARGMGYGPADLFQETGDALRLSNQVVDSNRVFAGNVANQDYQTQTAPAMQLLTGEVAGSQGQLLTPSSSLSLLLAPYQAQLEASKSTAANNTSLWNAQTQGESSLIGSLI